MGKQGNSLFLVPVTEGEVKEFINSLKGGSAPGWDNLTAESLKQISNFIGKPLEHIFNPSLKTDKFPDAFKKSKVIPLFKKGAPEVVSNYRPISLTSNLSKILEKVMKKRLNSFLDKFKIISDNQYGFRKNTNTQNAVVDLVSAVTQEIDKGKKPVLVLLDIEKAFDSVTHEKLLNKLESVGVRGLANKWFRSYLENRKQTVHLEGITSEEMLCTTGLPQGTVLSPTFFLIYVNKLCNMLLEGKLFCFADDSALLVSSENWEKSFEIASREITKIYFWLRNNNLKTNTEKTNYITFSANAAGQPCETL